VIRDPRCVPAIFYSQSSILAPATSVQFIQRGEGVPKNQEAITAILNSVAVEK
jgi:hypothetical protein